MIPSPVVDSNTAYYYIYCPTDGKPSQNTNMSQHPWDYPQLTDSTFSINQSLTTTDVSGCSSTQCKSLANLVQYATYQSAASCISILVDEPPSAGETSAVQFTHTSIVSIVGNQSSAYPIPSLSTESSEQTVSLFVVGDGEKSSTLVVKSLTLSLTTTPVTTEEGQCMYNFYDTIFTVNNKSTLILNNVELRIELTGDSVTHLYNAFVDSSEATFYNWKCLFTANMDWEYKYTVFADCELF